MSLLGNIKQTTGRNTHSLYEAFFFVVSIIILLSGCVKLAPDIEGRSYLWQASQ